MGSAARQILSITTASVVVQVLQWLAVPAQGGDAVPLTASLCLACQHLVEAKGPLLRVMVTRPRL